MRIIVADDPEDLAGRASEIVAELMTASPGPRVSLGLAGGSTPRATYERLRWLDVEWDRVDAWLSDERWVPPDHELSNGQMARKALLDAVPATFFNISWGEERPPQAAAEEYAWTLGNVLNPEPDVVMLGLGEDGHTASLFPGTAALFEEDFDYVANLVPDKGWRLTATLPLLHRARHLVFLAAGANKARILARVIGGDALPASVVIEGAKNVTWIVDEDAAVDLV